MVLINILYQKLYPKLALEALNRQFEKTFKMPCQPLCAEPSMRTNAAAAAAALTPLCPLSHDDEMKPEATWAIFFP